jgi:signal transduction histidine kinase
MGTHGASVRARALPPARRAARSTTGDVNQRRQLNLTLTDWPVARRLFAVIVAALLMGLVFGALRVADAENSASQFSRTQQLANLGAQLTGVVNDLQNERDATLVNFLGGGNGSTLGALQAKTRSDLGPVRQELGSIVGGGFPATVQADASTVNNAVSAASVTDLQQLTSTASDPTAVFDDYAAVIGYLITLQQQVALGVTDSVLTSDVQSLNSLSLAKDDVAQEQALFDEVLTWDQAQPVIGTSDFGLNAGFLDFNTESSLRVANQEELTNLAAFQGTATQSESALFDALLGPQATKLASETMTDNLETGLFDDASGNPPTAANGTTPLVAVNQTNGIPLKQVLTANQPGVTNKAGNPSITTVDELQAAWDAGMGAKLNAMQTTENLVAGNIASRATQLQQSASGTALTYIIITVVVLLIVLLAALLVARSLVLPLRRLRAGALDVASVQLPERVRLLSDDPESAATMQVAPINVTSQDEIGQVARAFDQVHSEAVRLAGEQALLRSSFNAMFVNLSRRSQTLIERLARMIDTLEQNEDDPDRLGSLFSMDHLVTRMRRNSENLLLLAGHENPRKRSESVPIADIARAATSEIEQYNRVTLNIPPGVSVIGQAVSDVVHLIAELIENATIFSPKDTPVQVSMQELSSGGVLIEVVDKGIGVSEARLTEMNFRLDNPPTIDVSVSRHMGLFAVARLAERHRVRVRLRPALPQGLSALVWLPDSAIERSGGFGSGASNWSAQPVGTRTRAMASAADTAALTSGGGGSVGLASDYGTGTSDYGNGNGYGAAEGRTALGWFRGDEDGASRPRTAGALGGQDGGFSFGEPSISDQTVAGLPVRVPRANMPPGAGPGVPDEPASGAPGAPGGLTPGAQGGLPTRTPGGGRPAGTSHGPANDGPASPQRSPEQVRSRLAGFQRGTRRAEGQGGSGRQAPPPGEGTER